MQDKDFKRPGTSATMDMPSAPAATARQPISNKESDKTVNSQQETGKIRALVRGKTIPFLMLFFSCSDR